MLHGETWLSEHPDEDREDRRTQEPPELLPPVCPARESILVCDRDRAIARIDRVEPGPAGAGHEAEWLHRLERRGIIRRGSGKPTRQWVAGRSHLGRDLVAALLEEREEGP
jgi:hypothetical protein